MNTLEAVRDAQQMWEWKFQNAGRERIALNDGKRDVLSRVLGRIFHSATTKSAASRTGVGTPTQERHATAW